MRPIHQQIADLYAGDTFLSSSDREAQELEASKSKDTDGDGLVDYDELYVYKTSPYIADSDSDGYTDQEEIFSGNNPNCPTGKTCGVSGDGGETAGSAVSTDELLEAIGVEEVDVYTEVDLNSPEALESFFEQATLEQIRAALLDAGVSQEELDAIDDETLQLFFEDLIDAAITPDMLDAAASVTTDTQAPQS